MHVLFLKKNNSIQIGTICTDLYRLYIFFLYILYIIHLLSLHVLYFICSKINICLGVRAGVCVCACACAHVCALGVWKKMLFLNNSCYFAVKFKAPRAQQQHVCYDARLKNKAEPSLKGGYRRWRGTKTCVTPHGLSAMHTGGSVSAATAHEQSEQNAISEPHKTTPYITYHRSFPQCVSKLDPPIAVHAFDWAVLGTGGGWKWGVYRRKWRKKIVFVGSEQLGLGGSMEQ